MMNSKLQLLDEMAADAQREKRESIERAEEQYAVTMTAIARLRSKYQVTPSAPVMVAKPIPAPIPAPATDGGSTLIERIRLIARSINGSTFTVREVMESLEKMNGLPSGPNGRSIVGNTLRRLADEKELVLIEKGMGGNPSRYQMPK